MALAALQGSVDGVRGVKRARFSCRVDPSPGPAGLQQKRRVKLAQQTEYLEANPAGVAQAADLLVQGATVAFATETVYGLGADATNGSAVAAVYAAKGRPAFNPLIVHVADLAMAEQIGVFDDTARALAAAFWPGPMSLVVPLRPEAGIASLVTAGLETVAIRVPAHSGARALLAKFGGPVAAPSANPSGQVSPTKAAHVLDGLGGKIAAVLEGGDCQVGLESTILLVGEEVALLRAGGLAVEDVEGLIGKPVARPEDPETPQSPGQMAAHYATRAPLVMDWDGNAEGMVVIGFGPGEADFNLSESGDLQEAASNLFSMMRAADAVADGRQIAVRPIPKTGLGLAINDRLKRATVP